MIGFFPDPYPDELFYSVCARYGQRAGYASPAHTTQDLFGKRLLLSLALPHELNQLLARLPPGHGYTVAQLIDEHSLLPFYAPFLPPERLAQVRLRMAEAGAGPRKQAVAGLLAYHGLSPPSLRFCPVCVEADRQRYGETYWHRVHQLPCVLVCPSHAVWLVVGETALSHWERRSRLQTAEPIVKPTVAQWLEPEDKDALIHQWLAREARWLLDHSSTGSPLAELKSRYGQLLYARKLASAHGVIQLRKLRTELGRYYGATLLDALHCRLEEGRDWLQQLLLVRAHGAVAHHPLHHLLLLRFLDCPVADLLALPPQWEPFGAGPWPCLNPVCPCYQTPCIESYLLRPWRGAPQGRVIGQAANFRCACGFTYSRHVPGAVPKLAEEPYWVKEYGPVWEAALFQFSAEEEYTSREMGARLGVPASLVRSKLVQLKRGWTETKQTRAAARTAVRHAARAQKKTSYRAVLLQALQDHPGTNRRQLLQRLPVVYAWLFLQDREWVETVLPPPQLHLTPPAPRDWSARDAECAQSVPALVARLKQAPERPQRISYTALAQAMDLLPNLYTQAEHFPLTRAALNELAESFTDWAIRRIHWAAEQFRQTQQRPTAGQILKRAVVQRKAVRKEPKLQAALDEALQTFEQPRDQLAAPN